MLCYYYCFFFVFSFFPCVITASSLPSSPSPIDKSLDSSNSINESSQQQQTKQQQSLHQSDEDDDEQSLSVAGVHGHEKLNDQPHKNHNGEGGSNYNSSHNTIEPSYENTTDILSKLNINKNKDDDEKLTTTTTMTTDKDEENNTNANNSLTDTTISTSTTTATTNITAIQPKLNNHDSTNHDNINNVTGGGTEKVSISTNNVTSSTSPTTVTTPTSIENGNVHNKQEIIGNNNRMEQLYDIPVGES